MSRNQPNDPRSRDTKLAEARARAGVPPIPARNRDLHRLTDEQISHFLDYHHPWWGWCNEYQRNRLKAEQRARVTRKHARS